MKRILLATMVILRFVSNAYAFEDPLRHGSVFGSAGENTLTASVDGARYGLSCNGLTDTWAGLQPFLTAGAGRKVEFDNVVPCVLTGVSHTFVQSSTEIEGYGGAGLYFSHPSSTYVTISSTEYVSVKDTPCCLLIALVRW